MVAMKMRDKYMVDPAAAYFISGYLVLRTFATINQKNLFI